ncbi:FG-GAP repeat protein [Candidatus Poribacteria bacterium]|nr:FG-GAP repeat protein [Candidatus Poribacteria bacterium]
MRTNCKWLVAGGLAIMPALLSAQEVTVNLRTERTVQISDNLRNPGEMSPIVLGDVNGDGNDDLVLGSPQAGGFVTVDSGMVYIRYGRDYHSAPRGVAVYDDGGLYYDLTARPDAEANPLFSAVTMPDSFGQVPSGVQIIPERGGEFFGAAVAAGNFNGDTFTDIAITATNPLGTPKLATVYLLLGRADLGGLVQIEDEIFNGRAFEIKGREAGSQFGSVLGFADLDNDSFDDLLIGTPMATVGGTVDVVYGRAAFGFSRVGIDAIPDPHTRFSSLVPGERLGSSFAATDLNGDTFPELIMGAPRWPSAATARGRAVVWSLAATAPSTVSVDSTGTGAAMVVTSTLDFAEAGFCVGTGDLDGDSLVDIVVGAPRAQVLTIDAAGKVFFISNAARFVGGGASLPTNATTVIGGAIAQEYFGQTLGVGGYDSSPGDDLIVGAPGYSAGGFSRTGSIFIYRGGSIPAGTIDQQQVDVPITRWDVYLVNYRFATHLALGNFDGGSGVDIFASGDGLYPFGSQCGTEVLAEWQTCHNAREGRRVWGGISGTLNEPPIGLSAHAAWMLAE